MVMSQQGKKTTVVYSTAPLAVLLPGTFVLRVYQSNNFTAGRNKHWQAS